LKRLINAILILYVTSALFAQNAQNSGEVAPGGATMREMLKGFSIGLELGTHEYPLAVWYPAQSEDGYSIRSVYAKPQLFWEHSIANLDIYFEANLTADLWAADPSLGAQALNAKDADRKHWFFLYFEEEFTYRLPLAMQGTLGIFLNHRNNVYATPAFPARGVEGEDAYRAIDGKKFDGRLTAGPKYSNNLTAGEFYTKLGVPLDYLSRFSGDLGLGLELTLGYSAGDDFALKGITFEATPKMSFMPDVKYAGTEFELTYSWNSFKAALTLDSLEAFKEITVTPKLTCSFDQFSYCFGVEFGNLMTNWTFSPSIGLFWRY
jgi:hypothetical protein